MLSAHLRLRKQIGAGAMGSVWIAEDGSLDRDVAVKLVATDLRHDEDALQRFRREASLAAKIRSPHVVEIYSHGVSEDGSPFIVMELLEGVSLASRLDEGPLPLGLVREILQQVGRALTAAHRLGVVHRDVKPANVFLVDVPGYELFAKVVDFGIAKQSSGETGLTRTGAVIGTPWYMSPEQLTSTKDVDQRADLWATAVMVYQLLTGALPFVGDTIGAVSIAVSKGQFKPASQADSAPPAQLDRWFERAFDTDVDARFPSAAAMVKAFEAGCEEGAAAPFAGALERPDELVSDSTAAFVRQRELAVEVEEGDGPAARDGELDDGEPDDGAHDEAAEDDADREDGEGGRDEGEGTHGALVPAAAAATAAERAQASPRPRRWTWWLAAGVVGLVGLVWGLSRPDRSAAPPIPETASTAAAPRSTASTIGGGGSPAAPKTERASTRHGRLPPGHIQEVMRAHFDAFGTCMDLGPKRARVRTLRFVVDEDGSPKDVHIAELDPTTPEFDACLVSKLAGMRFARPVGGIATVTYPLTFSDDAWAPLDDGACELTPQCLETGHCSARGGSCVVKDDDDCVLAWVCTRQGLCHAEGNRCVAGSEGGPGSSSCQRYGQCLVEGGRARAGSDADCRASMACTEFGLCRVRAGVCVVDGDDACRKSFDCSKHGHCDAGGDQCIAGNDGDCRSSEDCTSYGWCSNRFQDCAALTNEDCRRSRGCRQQGNCSANTVGRCIAGSDADCRSSTLCAEADRCFAIDGSCGLEQR